MEKGQESGCKGSGRGKIPTRKEKEVVFVFNKEPGSGTHEGACSSLGPGPWEAIARAALWEKWGLRSRDHVTVLAKWGTSRPCPKKL